MTIRESLRAVPDPRQVLCSPLADRWVRSFPEGIIRSERVKWFRLHHPTDPNEWIGIGVYEQYNTGWTAHWIVCRVAIGF